MERFKKAFLTYFFMIRIEKSLVYLCKLYKGLEGNNLLTQGFTQMV